MTTKKISNSKIVVGFTFLVFFAFSFVIGVVMGFQNRPEVTKITTLFNKNSAFASPVDFDAYWKVWNIIDEKYVDKSKIDDTEKIWGSVKGLAASLNDPYTVFFDPTETKDFNEIIGGSFSGIGVEIGIKEGVLTVIAPLKNSPAQKAGIKEGDSILSIDQISTADMSVDESTKYIKGTKGTDVVLTIYRSGEESTRNITITRDIIDIPTIDTKLREDGVFVISLYSFSENAPVLFQGALREFLNTKSDKLVIDLRDNPGGYLDGAVDIASWFLPVGDVVVKEGQGASTDQVYRSKGYNIFKNKQIKAAILVNGGSASASEILAGALREQGVAKLIGEKTYGKGTVQELLPITSTTELKITVAKWFTPNGISIDENGLLPDIEIALTEEDYLSGIDTQMDTAIKYLLDITTPYSIKK